MAAPSRDELRAHLVRTMIAGEVATPRQNNLLHFRRMAAGKAYYQFGLEFARDWTYDEIFELMVERVGIDPDRTNVYGDDTIDPDLTIAALDRMGDRIALAAERRETVLLASGHPEAMAPVYAAIGRELSRRGCTIITPADGWTYRTEFHEMPAERRIAYVDGVAVLRAKEASHHTHDPRPMRAILAEISQTSLSWPDLAIADHGWAGAAGQAGVSVVGVADCNDPALFAGEAEGKIHVSVPLDDNVLPRHYRPLTAYLLARLT